MFPFCSLAENPTCPEGRCLRRLPTRTRVCQHAAMNEHECGFTAFLIEPTKRRVKALMELGEKRRRDVLDMLDHSMRFDPRFSHHLDGSDAWPTAVEALLRKAGSPSTCYVLSANDDLNGREMPLREALEAVIGKGDGAFVSCIPGVLGFYEFAEMKGHYLLSK